MTLYYLTANVPATRPSQLYSAMLICKEPPRCADFAALLGFLCMGSTAGSASLLLKTENVSCTGAKPLACAQSLAAKCDTLSTCAAFAISGTTASFYKADPQPPIPATSTKTLLAMPCNPVDPNQDVVFTPSEAENSSSGQLVVPGGLFLGESCELGGFVLAAGVLGFH